MRCFISLSLPSYLKNRAFSRSCPVKVSRCGQGNDKTRYFHFNVARNEIFKIKKVVIDLAVAAIVLGKMGLADTLGPGQIR
jgi:hypothetical protein